MSQQSPNIPPTDPAGEVFAALLEECSPLRWPPPWEFLAPDPDCFGPVGDDRAALARLRGRFDDDLLRQTGVLGAGPRGEPRLSPPLCNPAGAVVALRSAPGENPFDLLTARGCVLSRDLPLVVATRDGRTRGAMAALDWIVDGSLIVAGTRIREVALLRALGFPAAPATGLRRPQLGPLRAAVGAFGWAPQNCSEEGAAVWRGAPPDAPPPPGGGGAGDLAAPPPLPPDDRADGLPECPPEVVLVGWDVLALRRAAPALLPPLARHLAELGHHLGLSLSSVDVWRPTEEELKTARYRARWRDARLVRETLEGDLIWGRRHPLQAVADPNSGFNLEGPRPPPSLPDVHEALLARLASERAAGRRGGDDPFWPYQEAAQRELVRPLQEWALSQRDAVPRCAGLELANVCGQLHQLGPALHDLQAREIERCRSGQGPGPRHGLFAQHAQLGARMVALLNVLSRAARAPRDPDG